MELGIKNLEFLNYVNPIFTCKDTCCGHIFDIHRDMLKDRYHDATLICPICNPKYSNSTVSSLELSLRNYLTSIGVDFIPTDKTILGKKEIDIYIPSSQLAIEFNGIYWHSDKVNKNYNYHLEKTITCEQKGIDLFHIFEDEWIEKENIVKNIIAERFGILETIDSEECDIRIVENIENFLIDNHIEGMCYSTLNIGLYYYGDLVSVLCLEGNIIRRYCNILGFDIKNSFVKMVDYIKNDFKTIEVYSDYRLFNNDVYSEAGFVYCSLSEPDYYFVKNNRRYDKNTLLDDADKIYDCGKKKWLFVNQ